MTDYHLYRYSLVAAMSLMCFFSFSLFFGKLSFSAANRHYPRARRRMSLALLLLTLNYGVHLFAAPRFSHPEWCILLNLSTYFMAAWLFASSLLSLLSHTYPTPRRDIANAAAWVLFSAASALALRIAPQGTPDNMVLTAFSAVLMLYTLRLALMLIRAYRHAVRLIDSYYSDNVAAYIRWMSVFTWLAVFYGLGQGLLTFIPDRYVFLWILSSIPFYCYDYISYTNYSIAMKMVDEALDAEAPDTAAAGQDGGGTAVGEAAQPVRTAIDSLVERQIGKWIDSGNFTQQGLTIVQLAQQICTNRTYVSAYINRRYRMSFRDWINSLRLAYAKQLLATSPELTVTDIARRAGYLSLSNFTRLFTASEGISPGRWRKENAAS